MGRPLTTRLIKAIALFRLGWLQAELKKRFKKPVTHIIYSHSNAGHDSGGDAWGGGLEIIGNANNPLVKTTFDHTMAVKSGGKTIIELKYLGPGYGGDLIAKVLRPENVALVVDAISPKRQPFRNFPRTDIGGVIEQIKVVESIDFELIAPAPISGPPKI